MPRYTFLKSIVFRSIFRGFLRGLSPQNPEASPQGKGHRIQPSIVQTRSISLRSG